MPITFLAHNPASDDPTHFLPKHPQGWEWVSTLIDSGCSLHHPCHHNAFNSTKVTDTVDTTVDQGAVDIDAQLIPLSHHYKLDPHTTMASNTHSHHVLTKQLLDSGLPLQFWGYALKPACYISNHISGIHRPTPHGKPPDVSNL